MKCAFQLAFTCLAYSCMAVDVMASGTDKSVFIEALVNKTSSRPIESFPAIQATVKEIQASTGNPSPLEIRAQLLQRFVQQPNCGRIVFAVAQPASRTIWPQIGGQLNICEDGLPPLRVCPDRPATLVPPDAKCANGRLAQDTPEVAKAIDAALRSGNITSEQASKHNPKTKSP